MAESLVDQVREKYAGVARSGLSNEHPGARAVAEAFGYSPGDLASLPAEANRGCRAATRPRPPTSSRARSS